MAITATHELENCIRLAFELGLPRDQMENFLRYRYYPLPRGMEFHRAAREPVELVGYAGPRGEAKSHAVFAQVALDDCQRFPGSKWLYLRKIQKKAGEQLSDLIGKVLHAIPHHFTEGLVRFPNGSKIMIGGYRSENEINGYIGLEYDGIVLEDATTLTWSKVKKIRGSLRTSKSNQLPKLYAPANPGGVGHAWYKKLFYDPWKAGNETDTRFVYAQRGDNPFINPGYRRYLDGLTGWLRRAWRDGDMSIAAGQFFTTFSENVHVIEPFHVETGQLWWAAMDYGRVHWNVTYLLVRIGENIYVVDEHASRRQLIPQNATGIKDMLERYQLTTRGLNTFVAGHDCFATRHTERTIAEEYEHNGIKMDPARIDRVSRASRVLELLGNPRPLDGEMYIEPRLFIFDRCHHLIRCLPEMQHDPGRGEDVLKVDADSDTGEGGDDPYDALSMGLMVEFAVPHAAAPSIEVDKGMYKAHRTSRFMR